MKYLFTPLALLAVFLGATSLQAQQPETVTPGTRLQYRIHFHGSGTESVQGVQAFWNIIGPLPQDQQGRQQELMGSVAKVDNSTFSVILEVPQNAATADYKMWFRAVMKDALVTYSSPEDFQALVIHVVNKEPIKKPSVTVEEVPVRP